MGIDSHRHAALQLPRGFPFGARQRALPGRPTGPAITHCLPGPHTASLPGNALRLFPARRAAVLRPRALRPGLLAPREAAQRRGTATPARRRPRARRREGAEPRPRMRLRQRGGGGLCGSPPGRGGASGGAWPCVARRAEAERAAPVRRCGPGAEVARGCRWAAARGCPVGLPRPPEAARRSGVWKSCTPWLGKGRGRASGCVGAG